MESMEGEGSTWASTTKLEPGDGGRPLVAYQSVVLNFLIAFLSSVSYAAKYSARLCCWVYRTGAWSGQIIARCIHVAIRIVKGFVRAYFHIFSFCYDVYKALARLALPHKRAAAETR